MLQLCLDCSCRNGGLLRQVILDSSDDFISRFYILLFEQFASYLRLVVVQLPHSFRSQFFVTLPNERIAAYYQILCKASQREFIAGGSQFNISVE